MKEILIHLKPNNFPRYLDQLSELETAINAIDATKYNHDSRSVKVEPVVEERDGMEERDVMSEEVAITKEDVEREEEKRGGEVKGDGEEVKGDDERNDLARKEITPPIENEGESEGTGETQNALKEEEKKETEDSADNSNPTEATEEVTSDATTENAASYRCLFLTPPALSTYPFQTLFRFKMK